MHSLKKNHEEAHIIRCLKCIEEQLQWGDSTRWSSQDFEQLSDKVNQKTGVTISSNTLKRLWGRIPYASKPSATTLNTLAQFMEFENWSAFVATDPINKVVTGAKLDNLVNHSDTGKRNKPIWVWAIVVIALVLAVYGMTAISKPALNKNDFTFTAKKVAHGLPNSVIFTVDASSSRKADHIELQQNWDSRKRQDINRSDSLVTSIYYNPGYFDAKLVINDEIVKEHGLLIPSDGWMATLETENAPIYFNPQEFHNDQGIAVSVNLIESRNSDIPPSETFVNYFWVQDFEELTLNDLELETTVKNIAFERYNSCQKIDIILLCEGQAVIIPLSIKGCIADLELFYLNKAINGNRNDLSNFGVDFDNWVNVKCVSKNNRFSIYINGTLAHELSTKGETNKVFGVKYRFEGTGAISKLRLSNSNKTFLDE
ncbi:hypothetical protein [uncultured Croceitalea sp.]|uniref:hypothetical protein n=1 Tax=uncultured Croceitalea sp. TaxID=1798908 RepID=UPI0033069119